MTQKRQIASVRMFVLDIYYDLWQEWGNLAPNYMQTMAVNALSRSEKTLENSPLLFCNERVQMLVDLQKAVDQLYALAKRVLLKAPLLPAFGWVIGNHPDKIDSIHALLFHVFMMILSFAQVVFDCWGNRKRHFQPHFSDSSMLQSHHITYLIFNSESNHRIFHHIFQAKNEWIETFASARNLHQQLKKSLGQLSRTQQYTRVSKVCVTDVHTLLLLDGNHTKLEMDGD